MGLDLSCPYYKKSTAYKLFSFHLGSIALEIFLFNYFRSINHFYLKNINISIQNFTFTDVLNYDKVLKI